MMIIKQQSLNQESKSKTGRQHALEEIINRRSDEIKRTAHIHLITLFWEIGCVLKTFIQKPEKARSAKEAVLKLSKKLIVAYGDCFSVKELNRMQQFPEKFPDFSFVQKYIPLLSWAHLRILLDVENDMARAYYLSVMLQQSLDIRQLKKIVAENLFAQVFNDGMDADKIKLHIKQEYAALDKALANAALVKLNDACKPDLFKKSFSQYHALLKGRGNTGMLQAEDDLYKAVSALIEEYRVSRISAFNLMLNMLYWEVGKQLNNNNEQICLAKAGNVLTKYYKSFSEEQLTAMVQLAKLFPDVKGAVYVSSMIGWEYILKLLPLNDAKAIYFYIKQIVENKLSLSALEQMITEKTFEHRGHRESAYLLNYKTIVNKRAAKKGNRVQHIKITDYAYEQKGYFTGNLLDNPYFIDFVNGR